MLQTKLKYDLIAEKVSTLTRTEKTQNLRIAMLASLALVAMVAIGILQPHPRTQGAMILIAIGLLCESLRWVLKKDDLMYAYMDLNNARVVLYSKSWTRGNEVVARAFVLINDFDQARKLRPEEATMVVPFRYLLFMDNPPAGIVPTGSLEDAEKLENHPAIITQFSRELFVPFASEGLATYEWQKQTIRVVRPEDVASLLNGKL